MKTLATIGYRMNVENKKRYSEDIFRECLSDAGVDLLLDTRDYIQGPFWNPFNINAFVSDLGIKYLAEDDQYKYHKLLGMRDGAIDDIGLYKRKYIQKLNRNRHIFPVIKNIVDSNAKVAIMCCEPLVKWKLNCHRFFLAGALKKYGIVDKVEHLCMDETYNKMISKKSRQW